MACVEGKTEVMILSAALMTCSGDFPSVTVVLPYETVILLAKMLLFFNSSQQSVTGGSGKAHSHKVVTGKSAKTREVVMKILHGES